MNKEKEIVEQTRNYFEKSIRTILMKSLVGHTNLSEDTKKKIIENVKAVLETDGAKWEVEIEGTHLHLLPVNEIAIDSVYTGETADAMKAYLKSWKGFIEQLNKGVL